MSIDDTVIDDAVTGRVISAAYEQGLMVAGYSERGRQNPLFSLIVGEYSPGRLISLQAKSVDGNQVRVDICQENQQFPHQWVAEHLERTAKLFEMSAETLKNRINDRGTIRWRFEGYVDGEFTGGQDNVYPWNPNLWCFVSEVIGGADKHFAYAQHWAARLATKTLRHHRAEGIIVLDR